MTKVGYARVSSSSQNLEIQLQSLRDAGCEKVFSEKVTRTSLKQREALQECLDWLREGDTLVVTRLDRLARSGRDLHDVVAQLSSKDVGFQCLQQGAVNTTTSMGKFVLGILGAIAEFETDIRRERQREGIEKAKAAGRYKGRKPSVDAAEILRLKSDGVSPTAIAKRMGIGRASVYRALKQG